MHDENWQRYCTSAWRLSPRGARGRKHWQCGFQEGGEAQCFQIESYAKMFEGLWEVQLNLKLYWASVSIGDFVKTHSSFPSDSVVKNPLDNAIDSRDSGSVHWMGESPGGGHGNPL